MFESIWEDIKREYAYGNMVTRLVILNLAVFLGINLIQLVLTLTSGFRPSGLFTKIVKFFSFTPDIWFGLTHPWGILTHMFLHVGFFHFLFNMLFLYWFGRIVADLLGNQRILPLYLLGGLAGAVVFFLAGNLITDMGAYAYGASAAVMAIVLAAGVTAPEYTMHLILFGPVRLKYIVAVLVVLDLISIGNLANTGGHLGHLGGAAMGWFYVQQLRNGNDMAVPINRWIRQLSAFWSSLFSGGSNTGGRPAGPRAKSTGVPRNPLKRRGGARSDEEMSDQERLDAILDKIKENGYESLSAEEKEFLFNASKK
jgi:membrane associated rhomboid family serine protease